MSEAPYKCAKGVGAVSSVFAFNHERLPMSCFYSYPMCKMGGKGEGVVSCPACLCLPARNGLVNEVKFLGLILVMTNKIARSVIIT